MSRPNHRKGGVNVGRFCEAIRKAWTDVVCYATKVLRGHELNDVQDALDSDLRQRAKELIDMCDSGPIVFSPLHVSLSSYFGLDLIR